MATEFEIEAPGPNGPLAGTLLQPDGGLENIVLMIPGSGATDRDGNNPSGMKAATLKLLAEGLAARGIASVRIDKRGLFGSARAVADANAVTLEDYAHDVAQWVGVIGQRFPGIRIWILGHSEGGLVALCTEPQDPRVQGLVLLASPGRPVGQLLREQLSRDPENAVLLDEAFSALRLLESGLKVGVRPLHPALQGLFRPAIQPFMIHLLALNPVMRAALFAKPVLVVQGRRDLQVGVQDAELLARAAPNATLHLLDDANHVFKAVPLGDTAANRQTYGIAELPLTSGLVEAIAEFVAQAVVKPRKNVETSMQAHQKSFASPVDLYRALARVWAPDTASPTGAWSPAHRAQNHCSVTALIVQDYFGGKILSTKTSGGTHFYNSVDGVKWDLTASQFSEPIPYDDCVSSRDIAMGDTSEEKYMLLMERLGG